MRDAAVGKLKAAKLSHVWKESKFARYFEMYQCSPETDSSIPGNVLPMALPIIKSEAEYNNFLAR